MPELIDITGNRYGKLTVLSIAHRAPDRTWHWNCVCDCGEPRICTGRNLKGGKSKSCGCVHGIAISTPVTHEQLLRLLNYNQYTGLFHWLVEGRMYSTGDEAGHTNKRDSYVRIALDGVSYLAHQLAWFYMTGEWTDIVDHRDTITNNNKWENLREATQFQNTGNAKLHARSTTGFKGVRFRDGRYTAQCRRRHLGNFGTSEEAARAYDAEARKVFGAFARTNFGMPQ